MQKLRLTYPQQNILLVEKVNKGLPINSIVGTVEINSKFDGKICNDAINYVIKNNDAMRINIVTVGDKTYQTVNEFEYKNFEVIDLSLYSEDKIKEYVNDCALLPLFLEKNELFEFKIFKYGNGKGTIFMKIHHIISDAWSCSKIGTQLIEYIQAKLNDEEVVDELKPSYVEFVQKEIEYENSEKFVKDEEFWSEYLKGVKEAVTLSNVTNDRFDTEAKRYNVKLDEVLNERINEYCKVNKISPYALFMSAIATYIYRTKETNDFVIGTPVLNRANFKEKQMLGMFVSTIPMRIKINEGVSFIDLAKEVGRNNLELFRHQKYPYSKALELVRSNSDIKTNLYNIVLSYQNARADLLNNEVYSTTWTFVNHLPDELQIHVMDMDNTGILNINYDYKTSLFTDIQIKYLHERIMAIIEDALNNVNVDIENIRIMSKDEEEKILKEFNDTVTEYPKDKTLIQVFEEQVTKTPEKIALECEGNKITYKKLNENANKLAYFLQNKRNIKENDIVGVMIDKSFELIISILACLKCGAAYLPIEKSYPKDRIDYMISNSNCNNILVDNLEDIELNEKLINVKNILNDENEDCDIVCVSKDKYNENSIVYVMYTSGTTGNPKGVCVTNKNIMRLVMNTNYIDFKDTDSIIQTGATVFDASTFEIWGALLHGLPLYLIKKDDLLNPSYLQEYLVKNNITIMWLTAPLFNQMVDYNVNMFRNLRVLLVGGDVLSVKHINKLIEHCPNVQIINGYGPTENTTFSMCYLIKEKSESSIPIGKPIANSFGYIVDTKLRLLPMYVEGELLVSGDGVSKGYLNDTKKTNANFVMDPFNNGKIAYKTGDITYWQESGNIKFLGRKDHQFKIRGFRVELGEIRHAILKYPSVKDCYVMVREKGEKKNLVVLYTAINKVNSNLIIDFLKNILPSHMIPNVAIQIDSIPLNKNGKVDVNSVNKIIDKLEYRNSELRENIEYEGVYKTIYELFSEVLNKKDIYSNDNFFEIGGDSLLAIQLVTKSISKNITITYNDLYKNPSIKQLGDMLNESIENKSISKGIEEYDYSNINELLKHNKINKNLNNNEELGNVLLTGATGFLGAHILDEFMENEKGKIFCLVREKNNVDIQKRIKNRLNFFFGNKYDNEIGNRIILINGNMNNDRIIDSKTQYDIIKNEVTTVINSAANVKHFGDVEEFKKINVKAVDNLVKFCVKNNKKLIHISTLSVSGNILETGQVEQVNIKPNTIYNENNLYIGQNLDNVYAFTKFLAEKIVLDAICYNGLNAKIMRMGNLTGRMYDGKFQPNVSDNAFANRLKTFIGLKVIPKNLLDFYLEFTPIDYAARAVIALSRSNSYYNVFHLFNHRHVEMLDVLENFEKLGIHLNKISKEEMTELIKRLSSHAKDHEKINGIILDVNKNKEIEYKPNVIVKSDFTIEILKSLGFDWPSVDGEYIKKYINYLFDIKFLTKEEDS